jgi:hypothetical protein
MDDKRLLELWNTGKSMAQIAAELHVTRSKVSGWVRRARKRGVKLKARSTAVTGTFIPVQHKPKPKSEPVQSNEPQGPRMPVSLADHADSMCRAVMSYKDELVYCAWPRLHGRPYCATCGSDKSYPAPTKSLYRKYTKGTP